MVERISFGSEPDVPDNLTGSRDSDRHAFNTNAAISEEVQSQDEAEGPDATHHDECDYGFTSKCYNNPLLLHSLQKGSLIAKQTKIE